MNEDNIQFKSSIPSSELSLLSPAIQLQKPKTLFNSIFRSPSTECRSKGKSNCTFSMSFFNNNKALKSQYKCIKGNSSLINSSYSTVNDNKAVIKRIKPYAHLRKLNKTVIHNKKSIREPVKAMTIKKLKSTNRLSIKKCCQSLSLSLSSTPVNQSLNHSHCHNHNHNSIYPMLSSKKRIENIIPKAIPADKLQSTNDFIKNLSTSLLIHQQKLFNQQANLINKEINKAYGTYFTLIKSNKLSEQYRVSKKYIDVFPDYDLEDYYQQRFDRKAKTRRRADYRKYSSLNQMMMLIEKNKYYRVYYTKLKRVMIKAALQFRQMNLDIIDFYDYYHIHTKPFEHKDSIPLITAVKNGEIDLVKTMLKENPCLVSSFDNTPLHWAAKRNDVPMLMLLIATWGDVNAKDIIDNTPLHIAAQMNHFKIVQMLLYSLALPRLKNKFDLTPYDCSKGKLIKYIIQRASLLNIYYSMGKTKDYEANVKKALRYVYEEELRSQCIWYRKYI